MIYIAMCTCNGEKYIREQLYSIECNSVKEWKLYVMDDCSVDSTVDIVKEFEDNHQGKVSLEVNTERKGASRNFIDLIVKIAMLMDEEDYLMLCDQDDVWDTDKIEKTLTGMEELVGSCVNGMPLLVCTDARVVDENLNEVSPSFRRMNHYHVNKLDFAHLMMENKVQGCTVMLNKSLAKMLRYSTDINMYDGWLALIAASFGRIKYIDSPTLKYRLHGGNAVGSIAFSDDLKGKAHNLNGQKQIVFGGAGQIAAFVRIYGDELTAEVKEQAQAFYTLSSQGFWKRRGSIIKYHMWKSGILRNLGLMILI